MHQLQFLALKLKRHGWSYQALSSDPPPPRTNSPHQPQMGGGGWGMGRDPEVFFATTAILIPRN